MRKLMLLIVPLMVACGGDGGGPSEPDVNSVASVRVTPSVASLYPGMTGSLTATPINPYGATLPDRPAAWTTSNAAVVRVTDGLMEGVSGGTATVTATIEGRQGTAAVTVMPCESYVGGAFQRGSVIRVGQTVSGTMSVGDLQLSDGSYLDQYSLTLAQATVVTITMRSNVFDSFLGLSDMYGNIQDADDDSGGGLDAQIVRTLASGCYVIWATTLYGNQTGAYTLSVR